MSMKCEVDTCADGESALELILQHNGDRYWAIVSDLGLPVLDGCTLIQKIRKFERIHQLPPLTAVALSGNPEQRDQALLSGYDYFLVSLYCRSIPPA